MSKVVSEPGVAQGRIPEGHTLTISLADFDVTERGRETVETRIVFAEARHSDLGEILGSKVFMPDGSVQIDGDWPAWAESVMVTRLSKASQL